MYRRKYMSGDELSTANVVGILALFCCMSEFAILTPSIAAFSQHFAGTDITTIMFANSITGVVSVPVGIISGSALHKVGFKPAGLLGFGITIQFVFNLIYTTLAGYLTELGWNYSFLAYLIGLVPLVIAAIWMPEAKWHVLDKADRGIPTAAAKGPKEKVPRAIWGYALFALACWTCVVTVQIVT